MLTSRTRRSGIAPPARGGTWRVLAATLCALMGVWLLPASAVAQALRPRPESPQPSPPSGLTAQVGTPSTDALALANAMSAQAGLVTGASFVVGPSSGRSAGTSGPAGHLFPTHGADFAILTTGDLANADPPNDAPDAGRDNGSSARGVHDLTTLRVDVDVPEGHACLAFEFAYYSEEFPEFANVRFNDAFIAELGATNWTFDARTGKVAAPKNFASDENGDQITINTAFFLESSTGLQYDGSTALLEARTPVRPGTQSVFFTIYDAGDGAYDSAVFLDNLQTFPAGASGRCTAGARQVDTDGDGLRDSWETDGVTIDGRRVNLPAMGANPMRKDIFVEIDWMAHHKLSRSAIRDVTSAFITAPVANPDGSTGITLHIDNGPTSVMNIHTGETWGSRSRARRLAAHDNVLGQNVDFVPGVQPVYSWAEFDAAREQDAARRPVFHYVISAHSIGGAVGAARGVPSSDAVIALASECEDTLLVVLSGDCSGSAQQQAGTLMHLLGHNLGLRDGGGDDIAFKPNYLSVMNPSFTWSLLSVGEGRRLDYSRFNSSGGGGTDPDGTLPTLDERVLREPAGIGGGEGLSGWSTVHFVAEGAACVGAGAIAAGVARVPVSGPVDWSCDNDFDDELSRDVNADGEVSVLESYDDWANLIYEGGRVGDLTPDALPARTPATEPTAEELSRTEAVLPPPPAAPENIVPPRISSAPRLARTATCAPGDWANGVSSASYEWLRDGAPITGATASTYEPVLVDVGTTLVCRVTARNEDGSAVARSAATPGAPLVCPGPGVPDRSDGDEVRLTSGQLLINQRISQAAVRRVNALTTELESGIDTDPAPPRRREGAADDVQITTGQLRINQRISQAAVRRVNALKRAMEGKLPAPEPAARPEPAQFALSAGQLSINQRISQAAVRRVNALTSCVG